MTKLPMKITELEIAGLLLLEPNVFHDERGFFLESWNQRTFDQAIGRHVEFVQDNRLRSSRGVLRGLHYQVAPVSQGKLVSVLSGAIFDVAVDLRHESSTYGRSFGCKLTAEDHLMLWIPPGFAHGFLVTSDSADVAYKSTGFYSPELERRIRWDDPDLAIPWPLRPGEPMLSNKDATAPLFRDLSL
jgi:dTDP-4-dehydrorhamnose 3,5-epimerase